MKDFMKTVKSLFSGKSKANKGQVLAAMTLIAGIALTLGIAVIVTALSVDIVDNFQDTQTANSLAFNATTAGLNGMANFSDNFTTIGTVAGAVVLIGMVVGGLGVFVGRRLFG